MSGLPVAEVGALSHTFRAEEGHQVFVFDSCEAARYLVVSRSDEGERWKPQAAAKCYHGASLLAAQAASRCHGTAAILSVEELTEAPDAAC